VEGHQHQSALPRNTIDGQLGALVRNSPTSTASATSLSR
jgi:hypothetical protein